MSDKFPSLAALRAAMKEDLDYRFVLADRRSWATIIAPHGGFIEPGTSALARATAAGEFNLFDFQGLRVRKGSELHVTSTRFRDPRLEAMLARSKTALSLHCMGNCGEAVIWLGGRNLRLKRLVLKNLLSQGFAVNPESPRYRGVSPRNIVNLPRLEGVQLELSDELMAELYCGARFEPARAMLAGTGKFTALVDALRNSLRTFKNELRLVCN